MNDQELEALSKKLRVALRPRAKPAGAPHVPLIIPGGLTPAEVDLVRRGGLPGNLNGARLLHYHGVKPARYRGK